MCVCGVCVCVVREKEREEKRKTLTFVSCTRHSTLKKIYILLQYNNKIINQTALFGDKMVKKSFQE